MPENAGFKLEIFAGVYMVVMLTVVGLRFYARYLVGHRYGWEDWIVVASLITCFGQAIFSIVGVHEAGIGLHVEYLEETEPEIIPKFLKYLMTYAIIYEATVNWPKLSICLFYYRLFPQRITRFILLVIAFILIATAVSTVIATLASCDPFWANWGNSEEQAKYCFNRETLFIWLSFPNIITDVAMLVLPLPVVWKLNAPMAIRLGLTATFVISSLGLVFSIFRFVSFNKTNSFVDPTYNAVELLIWTLAEPGIYLLSACLVTYRPLLEKVLEFLGLSHKKAKSTKASTEEGRGRFFDPRGTFGSPLRTPRKTGYGVAEDSIALNTFVGMQTAIDGTKETAHTSQEQILEQQRTEEDRGSPSAHGSSHDAIRRTTDIQMTWEHV